MLCDELTTIFREPRAPVLLRKSTSSENQQFNQTKVNFRFWHKATIQQSCTFRKTGAAINLQHLVNIGCNEVVTSMPLTISISPAI
jgi:hypothetical protein